MKFRNYALGAAFFAAAGLVAGSATAAEKIVWWHAMGGKLGETVNTISKDFNASQSDYVLTPVYKGGYEDTMTAAIAAFRAGEQPNIVQIFDAGAATIINAKGAIVPVQDLLEANGGNFDINDYISGVRYFYADEDGKMIGMPFNSSTPLLYYNKEALAKAGVDAPKTWEDFEAIAPKLKEAGYIGLAQSHSPWIFSENFHSRHNIQLASNNNGYGGAKGTTINYNNDHLKMHWSKVLEWKKNGWYEFYGRSWGDNQKAFTEKKVAMWLGSSGSFGGMKSAGIVDFGTTYLPYWNSINKDAGSTFIGGAALFAMSGKTDAENMGVAAFFKFLTKPETQFFWHRQTGYVPITEAAYELAKSEGYYKEQPDAEIGIKQLSLPGGEWTKGYRLGYYVQIREVMNAQYEKMFAGDVTVDEGFKVIEVESNKLLKRFARTVK